MAICEAFVALTGACIAVFVLRALDSTAATVESIGRIERAIDANSVAVDVPSRGLLPAKIAAIAVDTVEPELKSWTALQIGACMHARTCVPVAHFEADAE